jgi:hypothetical protein
MCFPTDFCFTPKAAGSRRHHVTGGFPEGIDSVNHLAQQWINLI